MPFANAAEQPSPESEATVNPDVVQPSSMEALLQDVMEEEKTSTNEVIKELLRERVAEIRRLEDLLNKAKASLAELMQKNPEELAYSAQIPPSLREAANRTRNLLTGRY